MNRLGVITGLASEADCLSEIPVDRRPLVESAGASPEGARRVARALLSRGCTGLLSFGTAGGLDPDLGPGALVLAEAVVAPDGGRFATDAPWRDRLRAALSGEADMAVATLAGSGHAVSTPAAKRRLRETTGAAAVDMESLGVAEVAAQADVPFLALRAVADPAARAIPPWVMKAVLADGSIAPEAIIRPLLVRPWTVWALIGLARENGRALAALRRVASRAGAGFGLA